MELIYLVTGKHVTPLFIPAFSIADALRTAKLIDKRYTKAIISDLCNNF